MASKKSAANPYQWPDGSWHSISAQVHAQNEAFKNPNTPNLAQIAAGAPLIPPPAPPPPVVQPQPFDPGYENAKLGAGFNIQTGNAEAAYQTGQTAWSSGYNADGSLNTSNPYSQAQLFQDNYRRSVTGTNNSMAAAGQLYSGSRLNAQGRNDRLYAEGSSAQRDAARNAYHGIGVNQLQNYGSNSLGVSQAGYDSLRKSVYGG